MPLNKKFFLSLIMAICSLSSLSINASGIEEENYPVVVILGSPKNQDTYTTLQDEEIENLPPEKKLVYDNYSKDPEVLGLIAEKNALTEKLRAGLHGNNESILTSVLQALLVCEKKLENLANRFLYGTPRAGY
jgi:hypothetical protein